MIMYYSIGCYILMIYLTGVYNRLFCTSKNKKIFNIISVLLSPIIFPLLLIIDTIYLLFFKIWKRKIIKLVCFKLDIYGYDLFLYNKIINYIPKDINNIVFNIRKRINEFIFNRKHYAIQITTYNVHKKNVNKSFELLAAEKPNKQETYYFVEFNNDNFGISYRWDNYAGKFFFRRSAIKAAKKIKNKLSNITNESDVGLVTVKIMVINW